MAAVEESTREANELKEDLSQEVAEAIAQLNDSERKILTLKYMSGLTIQEISDVMGIGLSAAKMRLYRAMESFKEVYLKVKNQTP